MYSPRTQLHQSTPAPTKSMQHALLHCATFVVWCATCTCTPHLHTKSHLYTKAHLCTKPRVHHQPTPPCYPLTPDSNSETLVRVQYPHTHTCSYFTHMRTKSRPITSRPTHSPTLGISLRTPTEPRPRFTTSPEPYPHTPGAPHPIHLAHSPACICKPLLHTSTPSRAPTCALPPSLISLPQGVLPPPRGVPPGKASVPSQRCDGTQGGAREQSNRTAFVKHFLNHQRR